MAASRVAPVAGAAVTPGEDDDQQQRELDLLLRTPASLAGAIRQIETQVRQACQQRMSLAEDSADSPEDDEDDDDDEEEEEAEERDGGDAQQGDPKKKKAEDAPSCGSANMEFDSMKWPCFFFEAVVNLLAPFSVVLVWAAEGMPGLRRRDFIGIRRFPQWFILMGQYMLSLMTWLVVAMVVADPSILRREDIRVDFLYMITSIVIRSVLVAFKWATVPNPSLYNSSARRREMEIIFGWLAFTEGAAVRQAVKTVLHCRLGGEMPAVVMSQGTSLRRYRCGDTELVHAVAKASGNKLQKLGALTHRFKKDDSSNNGFAGPRRSSASNYGRPGLPGKRYLPRDPSSPERASDAGLSTPRPVVAEAWNPLNITGEDGRLSNLADDFNSASVGAEGRDEGNQQEHQPPAPGNAQQPPAVGGQRRASVQWRDARPGSSPAPMGVPSPASRFHFRGFGRAFNLPLTRIFAEITLRGGLQQRLGLRILLRASWALASALLPILVREMYARGSAIGSSTRGHVIVLTCAVEVFMINFNFQASYLECCVVTYYRLLYYMRELLAITTQDPCLLELSTLEQRALPVYMPLCMRANLLGWLRLRRALFRFGMSFRKRIQAFFGLALLRLFVFVALIAVQALESRDFCPTMAAVASLEMLVLTVVIITIVFTGIKIHKLMDEQLLQLQHLRLDWQIAESDYWDKVSEAAVAEKEVVQLAVDYALSDRRLNGLQLLGVPMDGRALVNIVATVVPLLSAMYYLSRFINFTA